MSNDFKTINADKLQQVVTEIFTRLEVPPAEAAVTADNLVAADLRGIASHGVARLQRYVGYLQEGKVRRQARLDIIKETPVSLTLDGNNSLGQPNSKQAMDLTIAKAAASGCAFTTMRRSAHYGIAGYYAMMALPHDMIGISLTNTAPLAVPTFSTACFLGTNPVAVALPAGKRYPIVVDMATTVIPRGKLEVYKRLEKPIPAGWAINEDGTMASDPGRVLANFDNKNPGGILPLGGAGEEFGGHKGYGINLLIDILCGVLSDGATGDGVYKNPKEANVCHFFGAVKVENFIAPARFKELIDNLIGTLKGLSKIPGQQTIFLHGEKEYLACEKNRKEGVKLHSKTATYLNDITAKLGISFKL